MELTDSFVTLPIVFPRPLHGPRPWRCSSPAWWSFGFTSRGISCYVLLRFPFRPWYRKNEEPSFTDMLTTLRWVSCEEKTQQLLPKQCRLKAWITQLTEFLSRTG